MRVIIILVATIIVLFLLIDFFFVLWLDKKSIDNKKEEAEETSSEDNKLKLDFSIRKKEYTIPDVNNILADDFDNDFHKDTYINNIIKLNRLFKKKKLKCECINYYENGKVVTYEIKIDKGQLIDDITKLEKGIIKILEVERLDFVIPFQSNTIGITVENVTINNILFKDSFNYLQNTKSKKNLLIPIGKNLCGNYELLDLCEVHNMVIGGDVASGKSTFLQDIICNILLRTTPLDVRFITIDTKGSDLFLYDNIDNFIYNSINDKDEAFEVIDQVIDEIYRRLDLIDSNMDRTIEEYNEEVKDWNNDHILEEEKKEKLNYIVFIIDDYSDLIDYKKIRFEKDLLILGEMGPKAGVHLVLASRKPLGFSNIVKGSIKTRICFNVSSEEESIAVIGSDKACSLYGVGDMYLLKKDEIEPIRVEAPNITINDVKEIVNYIKNVNSD